MKIKSLIFTFIISSAVLLTGCSSATETISDDHLSNGTASQETVSTTEPPSPTEEVPVDSTAVSTDSTTEALVSSETDPSPTPTTTQNRKSETTGQTAPPQTTTAPHVHRYTSKIVAPTCTSGGYTLYTCSCGAQYTDNHTDALGHDLGPWVTVKEPTLSSEGQRQAVCRRNDHIEVQSLPRLDKIDAFVQEVVELVNQERSKEGLPSLTGVTALHSYAATRSSELVSVFNHVRPDGSNPLHDVLQLGYRTAGENIAYGYATPQAVMDGWMNSPGHRANILSPNFSYIGVGCYQKGNTLYWTQIFAG